MFLLGSDDREVVGLAAADKCNMVVNPDDEGALICDGPLVSGTLPEGLEEAQLAFAYCNEDGQRLEAVKWGTLPVRSVTFILFVCFHPLW